MRNSSDSPDRLFPGGRQGDPWTVEQDQSLLKLREEHREYMNLKEIRKTFFPGRSQWAVTKRLSVLNKAGKQKASVGSSLSASGSNNRRPQRSTIQHEYIYSDDESQAMSLDSQSNAEEARGECTSEQRTSSKASLNLGILTLSTKHTNLGFVLYIQTDDISNPALSNTLKRKPSPENGPSRPSPSKLSRVPTVPIFTSIDLCSTRFSCANSPTTSNTNTAVDFGNNPTNSNHGNNTQVSSSSFKSSLMDFGDEDILHMFHQAKKCAAETKRAAELELELSSTNDILTRCRDENRALLDLQKQHDDEFEKAMENLLKERETEQMQLKVYNEGKLKLLEDICQLKTEFDKIKAGASKVIHPDMWKSGGMDAAAVQVVKITAQIEEALNAKVSSETKPSQVPLGDDLFLDAVESAG